MKKGTQSPNTHFDQSAYAARLSRAKSQEFTGLKLLAVGVLLGGCVDVVCFKASLAVAMDAAADDLSPWLIALAAALVYVIAAHASGKSWGMRLKAKDPQATPTLIISTIVMLAIPIAITICRLMYVDIETQQANELAQAAAASATSTLDAGSTDQSSGMRATLETVIYTALMVASALLGWLFGWENVTKTAFEESFDRSQQAADGHAFDCFYHDALDTAEMARIDEQIKDKRFQADDEIVSVQNLAFGLSSITDPAFTGLVYDAIRQIAYPAANPMNPATASPKEA